MKAIGSLAFGIALSVCASAAAASVASLVLAKPTEPPLLKSASAPDLWTATPVRIDRSQQNYQRLPPVYSTYVTNPVSAKRTSGRLALTAPTLVTSHTASRQPTAIGAQAATGPITPKPTRTAHTVDKYERASRLTRSCTRSTKTGRRKSIGGSWATRRPNRVPSRVPSAISRIEPMTTPTSPTTALEGTAFIHPKMRASKRATACGPCRGDEQPASQLRHEHSSAAPASPGRALRRLRHSRDRDPDG